MSELDIKNWLEIRKLAGLKIDPETAEVGWTYAQTFDPYGVEPDLPAEYDQIGRKYFARSPGSDVWVWFGDLPDEVRDKLWEKHHSKLALMLSCDDDSAWKINPNHGQRVARDEVCFGGDIDALRI